MREHKNSARASLESLDAEARGILWLNSDSEDTLLSALTSAHDTAQEPSSKGWYLPGLNGSVLRRKSNTVGRRGSKTTVYLLAESRASTEVPVSQEAIEKSPLGTFNHAEHLTETNGSSTQHALELAADAGVQSWPLVSPFREVASEASVADKELLNNLLKAIASPLGGQEAAGTEGIPGHEILTVAQVPSLSDGHNLLIRGY